MPGLPRFDGKSMPWSAFIQVFERRVFREAQEEMAVDAFLLVCRDRAAVKNLRGGESLSLSAQ